MFRSFIGSLLALCFFVSCFMIGSLIASEREEQNQEQKYSIGIFEGPEYEYTVIRRKK